MDETNTATSSSAAAVADGASAAASTKTVDTAASNTKSSSYVKLLIKASNQQFDDQVIESDFSWTVKRLKSHLSIVYPSKPPAADQKLIYSGHLLNDNLQLKDVIRSYKDVYTQNHIIHLVYTPKNLPPVTPSNSAALKKTKSTSSASTAAGLNNMTFEDALRQRHTSASANTGQVTSDNMQRAAAGQHVVNPGQMPYYSQYLPQTILANGLGSSYPQMAQNSMAAYGQFNMHALAMQQTAMYSWMQQVYTQYMEQCLRVSNGVNGLSDASATPTGGIANGQSTIPQYPFLPQFPQSVIPSAVAQATTINAAATAAAADQQVQPPQQPEQPAQAQVAAGRFPNMPQDEPDNRDWLDNIFSITRFALFLTILYFNSSPLRCLAVVIIAGGIYMYHIGVFRFRHERNNNNLNRNNNAAQNAAVDQIRQGVDQQQPEPGEDAEQQDNNAVENNIDNNTPAPPAVVANEGNEEQPPQQQSAVTTNSDNPNSTDSVADDNNGSMIATLRTFVVTFFTSLLPETQAV